MKRHDRPVGRGGLVFEVWPGPRGRVECIAVVPNTGEIVRTKITKWRKPVAFWKSRGFSLNGRLSVGTDGMNRA